MSWLLVFYYSLRNLAPTAQYSVCSCRHNRLSLPYIFTGWKEHNKIPTLVITTSFSRPSHHRIPVFFDKTTQTFLPGITILYFLLHTVRTHDSVVRSFDNWNGLRWKYYICKFNSHGDNRSVFCVSGTSHHNGVDQAARLTSWITNSNRVTLQKSKQHSL